MTAFLMSHQHLLGFATNALRACMLLAVVTTLLLLKQYKQLST